MRTSTSQRQAYDLLRKAAGGLGGQIIVATHSEVVLDATDPSRILGFFGQAPRALTSRTERDRIREALKRATTTDLLLAREVGAVLYVESEADEKILVEWARILGHPARRFFDRPFVRRLGGRSLREAKAHFFAMQAVVPGLRALCLGDNRDEPDDETANSGLAILRWRRYEIENYLLQPETIKRFVPSAARAVEEAVQRQVPPSSDLFWDHVSLVRVKASDEFLVPMLEEIGKDTPKKDLYLLAAAMMPEEIHPEVREKLDRIAASLDTSGTQA